jgi:hypothetical protein
MINKELCSQKVFNAFHKRNMLELSSGSGQDFCDAMGEAIYEALKEVQTELNLPTGYAVMHQHTCSAPGSPTAATVPPTLFKFVSEV